MDYYLFTARSITHAQLMARELERYGVYVKIRRAGPGMSRNGCGYTLQIAPRQYKTAVEALSRAGRRPVKVFSVRGDEMREVVP